MKALLFGAPPDEGEVRPTPEDELETALVGIPFGLHDIDDARLVRPDWVVTKPILSGICGSDAKLVLGDFNTGDIDNPMAAFSSLPHVPGHEVVAEVVALGLEPHGLDVGQRVVLNPWLTCGPRGIDPMCPPCQTGRPEPLLELHRRATSAPACTSGSSPAHRAHGPSGWPRTTPCSSRCPTASRTRPPCWPTRSRSRSTPSCGTPRRPAAGSSSTGPARSG